jgi:thiosulfate dehydrogenase
MPQLKQNDKVPIRPRVFFAVSLLTLVVIAGGLAVFASRFAGSVPSPLPILPQNTAGSRESTLNLHGRVAYNPPRLADAPEQIRDVVMLGYNILTETTKYAQPYVGNTLKCTNCHLKSGLTDGGLRGGISLVGVAVTYPKYRERQHAAVDLVRRTNDCFERSMNGKSLPPDSREMTAILTYYQWIARGLPIYADIPWLGLKKLKGDHKGNPVSGKQVFAARCAMCHGMDGQGTLIAPSLWGPHSFNDGAGMAKAATMSSFALLNMPNGNPDLKEEEAVDVAVFVTSQPRPKFKGR